ncbi:MAG: TniQ family protein [Acidobacteria bacterium]|nr:TniQ family protein [Acidobacteriota bacterium]
MQEPWHRGAQTINGDWPVPVDLLPDETITSWLARCALAQGCDPSALTGSLWPAWRIWTTDADRGIPTDRRGALERATGVAGAAIEAAALVPIGTRIVGDHPKDQAAWPWISTLGKGGGPTSRRQYCPKCLDEDATSHYRLRWRMAWHAGCAVHGCTLSDRCPRCDSAQQLHRLRADARDIAVCAACGFDLRGIETSPCRADTLEFQKTADRVARAGAGTCFDQQVDAAAWFATADFVCSLIRRVTRSPTKGLTRVLAAAGIDRPLRLHGVPGARIERLGVEDRHALLGAVQRVMRLKPDALSEALKVAGITRQGLLGDRRRLPEALKHALPAMPDRPATDRRRPRRRPRGPRPRHEVRAMMKRLARKLDRNRQ